jgi:hypothetical protein
MAKKFVNSVVKPDASPKNNRKAKKSPVAHSEPHWICDPHVKFTAVGFSIKRFTLSTDKTGTMIEQAYNENDEDIGSVDMAVRLYQKGISPRLAPDSSMCTIGWSVKDLKWYGWSHRAIYGFGIGHKVKKGDCVAGRVKVGFVAKTWLDCKMLAIEFAESVS